MPSRSVAPASPVALLANHDELLVRSLESILSPAGYVVLPAYTGRDALEAARRSGPDALVLGTDLADPSALTVCRILRSDAAITASTPVFLVHAGATSREQRLEALRAGADELWSQPLDTEEFLLRLAARLRAKRDADEARSAGLVDDATALYNDDGLVRRVGELLAEAARMRRPVSVVVFGAEGEGEGVREGAPEGTPALGKALAVALREAARDSDTVARLRPGWAVVAAPATGAEGAARLAERLVDALDRRLAAGTRRRPRARAGYATVIDPAAGPRDPAALIDQAVAAFRTGRGGGVAPAPP